MRWRGARRPGARRHGTCCATGQRSCCKPHQLAAFWALFPVPTPDGLSDMIWVWASKPAILASPFLFATAIGDLDAGLVVFALSGAALVWLTWAGALRWNRLLLAPACTVRRFAFPHPH